MTTALIIIGSAVAYLLAGGAAAGLFLRKWRTDPKRDGVSPVSLIAFVAAAWPLLAALYVMVLIVAAGMRVMGIRKSDLTTGGDA